MSPGCRTAPACEGRGRGDQGDAGSVLTLPDDADTIADPAARRAFWRRVDQRVRYARELDRLLTELSDPPPQRVPSTFGLTDDQIRAEFERLVTSGWSPGEVRVILAVTP